MSDVRKDVLFDILLANPVLGQALDDVPKLSLPNWYIAGGAISQTYWNHIHGFDPMNGIKDFDLVYYDTDTSYSAEDKFIKSADKLFKNLPIEVEIRNQARVHKWYPKRFGRHIKPYGSVEKGISSWATTITCIGINKEGVFAAHGLDDLFDLVVRPNKIQVTQHDYNKKANRWKSTWPKLTIIPW